MRESRKDEFELTLPSGSAPSGSAPSGFAAFLEPFAEHQPLQDRLLKVLMTLPPEAQDDFVNDSRFHVTLEIRTARGVMMWMPAPGPMGSESRCVVLRARLAESSEEFACYVIAHEFAHAFLRNGGWGEITDREEAADALAAEWGFPKPRRATLGFLRKG